MNRRAHTENLIDLSPPSSGTSTPVSQSASSSTYGLGSAITGLWRRIASNDPNALWPPTQSHSLSSSTHSATFPIFGGGDGIHGAYTPPRRTTSPRLLPSLEPLVLKGYRDDTEPEGRLLSNVVAEEIRTFLPERLKIGDEWRLVYSLYQNGSSLGTLLKLCDEYRGRRVGFVLVVRDGKGGTFGAYLTEAPHPSSHYFGTGECFLWRASVHVPLPPPPSEDTTGLLDIRSTTISSPATNNFPDSNGNGHLAPGTTDSTGKLSPTLPQHSVRFQNFCYTGENDYCIFCETGFLSVGGGSGTYGLWLDDGFSMGHSGTCDTFCNQPLSEEGEKFNVLGVELWVVGAH